MGNYIEFPLDDGGSIIMEVEDSGYPMATGGLESSSFGQDKIVTKAENSFEKAVQNVRSAADTLLDNLRSAANSPDEIELTFGLKASGELGGSFLVAKAGLEANYTVTLKWTKDN